MNTIFFGMIFSALFLLTAFSYCFSVILHMPTLSVKFYKAVKAIDVKAISSKISMFN